MANSMTGRNGSIGAGSIPVSPPNHPHWKMATTTPYAEAIDSMFMITALSGTSNERKTIARSRNDSESTAAKNTSVRLAMYAEKSIDAGTPPVMLTSRPVPAIAAGTTSERRNFTSSSVSSACGEVVATSCMRNASLCSGASTLLGNGGLTNATPSVPAMAACSGSRPAASAGESTVIATSIGPFEPGPKPSATRS